MAHELVRQRSRDAADGEGEDDVLDGRAVPGLDDRADELLHLERVEVAVDRAPEDLVGVLLGVAGPAGRVDDRDVVLLDDLAVREDQRRPHPEVAPPGVLGDPGLLARRLGAASSGWSSEGQSSRVRRADPPRPPGTRRSVVVGTGQEVAAAADELALALVHRGAAVRAGQHRAAPGSDVGGGRGRLGVIDQGDRHARRDGTVRRSSARSYASWTASEVDRIGRPRGRTRSPRRASRPRPPRRIGRGPPTTSAVRTPGRTPVSKVSST